MNLAVHDHEVRFEVFGRQPEITVKLCAKG